jgi:hypothetical protein
MVEQAAATVAALREGANATPPPAEEEPGPDPQGMGEEPPPSAPDAEPLPSAPDEARPAGGGHEPAPADDGGDDSERAVGTPAPTAEPAARPTPTETASPSGQADDVPDATNVPASGVVGDWKDAPDAWDATGHSDSSGSATPPLHGLALLLSERAASSGPAESDIVNTELVRGGSIDEIE